MTKSAGPSQMPALIAALRQLLRARGLRHCDIAQRLGVTERTVTRWLSSDNIDMHTIEQLCGLAGLGFFELCDFASKQLDKRRNRLTLKQESALAEDPTLPFLFFHFLKGWSARELQAEADIPEPVLVRALIRLEKLGLIELLPGNEIRLLTAREVEWPTGGPFSHMLNSWLTDVFQRIDINEKQGALMMEVLKLSQASIAATEKKFSLLLQEIRQLAESDRQLQTSEKQWFTVLLAARHNEMRPYAEWAGYPQSRPQPTPVSRRHPQ